MVRPALTIITQWYPPEQAPFGRMMSELAIDMAAAGWEVTVITGFPNHPTGEVFKGYRKRWVQEEDHDGVKICRVWLATSAKRSMMTRLATFASFTVTSSLLALQRPRPDLIFAVLQPLSLGLLLPWVARMKRTGVVFNIQDLHPDTQIRLGMVRNPLLIRVLRWIERRAYTRCAGLTVICEPFRAHAIARGAVADRTIVIGNWIDTDRIRPVGEGAEFRKSCGLDESQFVVLWAGTLGHVSGASVIVDAALCLRDDPRVRFLVVGEGPLRESLHARVRALALGNVVFCPFQPEQRLAAVQSSGNVSLVTLAPDFAESSVPSKLLAYLAAGRPVIGSVPAESETASLISKAAAGVVVEPGDGASLAAAIQALADDPARVRRFGAAARAYAVDQLSRPAALARYREAFARLGSVA